MLDDEQQKRQRERLRYRNTARLKEFGATIRASAAGPTEEFDWTRAWPNKANSVDARRIYKSIRRCSEKARQRTIRADRQRYVKPDGGGHGSLTAKLFDAFWNIQGGRCYLCAKPFHVDDWPTLDHVTPVARGGRDAGNILLACFRCNGLKGSREPMPCELLYLESARLRLIAAFEELEAGAPSPSALASSAARG